MTPIATETFVFDGREILLNWFSGLPDPTIKVSQVSAYCIYEGQLLLVKNKRGWGIPGGHPESQESWEETLKRELSEEVGIKENFQFKILGWMKVEDPKNPGLEGKVSAQIRYLVTLNELPDFIANEEIFDCKLINIDDFDKYVSWANSPTGEAQSITLKTNLK